jgi:signal peptidase II
MLKFLRRWATLIIFSSGVIALDQTAKWFVTSRLALGDSWDPIPAIAGFIRVTYSYNTGAAFGFLPQAAPFFLGLALITTVVFIITYPRLPTSALMSRIGIAMIIGGALSNASDRLRLGHVVDFVHVQLTPNFANISNFADHAITIGVILLLIDQYRIEQRELRARVEAREQNALEGTMEDGGAGPTTEPLHRIGLDDRTEAKQPPG